MTNSLKDMDGGRTETPREKLLFQQVLKFLPGSGKGRNDLIPSFLSPGGSRVGKPQACGQACLQCPSAVADRQREGTNLLTPLCHPRPGFVNVLSV